MSHAVSQSQAPSRNKYRSPELRATTSMTPPPSSQQAALSATARTPTPTHSHLSSPPPTVKGPSRHTSHKDIDMLSGQQIENASIEELRTMITDLSGAYREARASTAHQTLQYNLLWMESSESSKRMQVELDMARREVDVLQEKLQDRRQASAFATPVPSHNGSPGDCILSAMRHQCYALQVEVDELRHRLSDTNLVMLERQTALEEENKRLRERIRTNRKHATLLRDLAVLEQEAPTAQTTPYAPDNRQARMHEFASARKEPSALDALIAAGDMMSHQETGMGTPSTPRAGRAAGHTRGAFSMSAIPSTPIQVRTAPQQARHQPGYYDLESPLAPKSAKQLRRRESRDSTISVSEDEGTTSRGYEDHDVPMSQASQEAAELLRGSATGSGSAASASKKSGLTQSKLYGQVKKPTGSPTKKRTRVASSTRNGSESKKARMREGVGLGIGQWAP